jgi:hypothetical protein
VWELAPLSQTQLGLALVIKCTALALDIEFI